MKNASEKFGAFVMGVAMMLSKSQIIPPALKCKRQTAFQSFYTTLEGSLFQLENGDWKGEKEFVTLAEAKAWLDGKVGITTEGD